MQKFDDEKTRWDLMPMVAIEQVAKVMTFGARKYKPEGWRTVPEGRRRYLAAAYRHIVSWHQGGRLDPESKLPHLAHAACCLLFLIEFEDDTGIPE